MFTLNEINCVLGLNAFEILHHLPALFIFSVLLALRLSFGFSVSFCYIFMPLLVASAFNVYYHFIIFTRKSVETKQIKSAFSSSLFNIIRAILFALFEFMLYRKIDGDFEHRQVANQHTWRTVFLPVWVLLALFGFQGCRTM